MKNITYAEPLLKGNTLMASSSIVAALVSLLSLLGLHFLSPEFGPSWRMVSEYANGRFEWLLMIFFVSWGISSWCLAWVLWSYVSMLVAKAGVVLLFVSGFGEILAAFFNVNHPLHGMTGTLGIPTFILASLIISYHLKNKSAWADTKAGLLVLAHGTWISLALLIVSLVAMIAGFKSAGIAIGHGQQPPSSLPEGVIGVAGYANRILIACYIAWLLFVARNYVRIAKANALLNDYLP
jgi:hypothetical protein